MPTSAIASSINATNPLTTPYAYTKPSKLPAVLNITAASNLNTYYVMQGFDTIGNAWISWVVQGTPDTTASRHPTPGSVSVSGAFVVDRFQA